MKSLFFNALSLFCRAHPGRKGCHHVSWNHRLGHHLLKQSGLQKRNRMNRGPSGPKDNGLRLFEQVLQFHQSREESSRRIVVIQFFGIGWQGLGPPFASIPLEVIRKSDIWRSSDPNR